MDIIQKLCKINNSFRKLTNRIRNSTEKRQNHGQPYTEQFK